ncbi:MAG: hypothetical protein WC443_11605 [Desulfobaccales bacterium]
MHRILSEEEMAALLAGWPEAKAGLASELSSAPRMAPSRSLELPQRRQIPSFHIISNWLIAVRELRWPHL